MQWKKIKEMARQFLLAAGILLWIGVTGPEIYVEAGLGCLMDQEGRKMTRQEAEAFLEEFFYNRDNAEEEIQATGE